MNHTSPHSDPLDLDQMKKISSATEAQAGGQSFAVLYEQAQRQLDAILEGVGSGVMAYNSAGECIFINDIGARMSGYASAQAFIGAPRSEVFERFEMFDEQGNPLSADKLPSRLAFQGVKEPAEIAIQYRIKGTEEMKWSLVKSKPLFDEMGKVQMVVTIFTDFTERKKASLEREKYHRDALLERARLEAILRQVDAGVIILDAKTKEALFLNDKIHKIWGTSEIPRDPGLRYQLKGFRSDGTQLKPQDWPSYRATEEGIAIRDEEIRIIRADGKHAFIRCSADPIRDPAGELVAAVVTIQDITEIRKQELASRFLDEASRIFSSSLDYNTTLKTVAKLAVPRLGDWCSVTVVEPTGPSYLAVVHQDPKKIEIAEEFRSKYPTDWNSNDGAPTVLRTGKSILAPVVTEEMITAIAIDTEHLRLLKALEVNSVIIVPIQGRQETLGVLTLVLSGKTGHYDDFDLKTAEELGRRAGQAIENARLYDQAQKAVRSRDSLISVSAHELLTPISGSKLQMQLMKKRLDQGIEITPETLRKMVNQTERQLDRLHRLVNEMLDLSRINLGKLVIEKSKTDLSHLVKDLVERMVGQLQAAGCAVSTEIEPGIVAEVDSYRIEQVLTNLLSNAIRYARGTPVRVRLSSEKEDRVCLEVQDHGIGIRKEDQERIFQRFERAASIDEGSGLGLGLFVVKQIVEGHRGTITLESELGKGSTFRVWLPLYGDINT
jgi:signal transduction histidine kinase/PAS domain-containing protein